MSINISNPFSLKSSVGWNGSNDRTDVAKVEHLLGRTGDLNLKETDGLTGYYGARVEQAGKRHQKRNNLKQDGHFNPNGESIRSLRTQLAQNDDKPKEKEKTDKPSTSPEDDYDEEEPSFFRDNLFIPLTKGMDKYGPKKSPDYLGRFYKGGERG